MPIREVVRANLTDRESYDLLDAHDIGRVILTVGALPVALLVNYWLVDGAIVFRAGRGGKVGDATDRTVVGFEADHVDREAQSGWRVAVVGMAHHVTAAADIARLDHLRLPSWIVEDPGHYVRIEIKKLSGRRFGVSPTVTAT